MLLLHRLAVEHGMRVKLVLLRVDARGRRRGRGALM